MGTTTDLWKLYAMAIDDVTRGLGGYVPALNEKSVPFALVGGQAVALWPHRSRSSVCPLAPFC